MPVKPEAQPIDRIFAILDAVIAAKKAVSLAEIALRAGMPAPTVHRLVGNLEERGLLKRSIGFPKLILAGPRLLEMSRSTLDAAVVADMPHEILEQLASELQEYCQIGTIRNGAVLYVDVAKAHRTSGLQLEQGNSAPLHCTSMGKLYLASLDDGALRSWVRARKLEKLTPRTITQAKALIADIECVRTRGWAAVNEEFGAGIVGCSVEIPTGISRNAFYVGISAPAARVPFAKLETFVDRLREAARKIAAAMAEADCAAADADA